MGGQGSLLTIALDLGFGVERVAVDTGAGMRMSVQPRFAIACWLTSATDMPVTTAKVSALLTIGWPNSVWRAYSRSKCSGCRFMVSSVNQVLSASVMVRPGRCS